MGIAPGNVISLSPASQGWSVQVNCEGHPHSLPIAAWAVVCQAEDPTGTTTAVEPLVLASDRITLLREYLAFLGGGDGRHISHEIQAPA